ncbi:MAG: hypothetical protein GY804_11475 [Alphaproteobacteria bacterium]|nr:hypothetical protein [Alphaproteobacteria bacterium]
MNKKDEIIKRLAESDPWYTSEWGGQEICFFCGIWRMDMDESGHWDNCLWERAKSLVEKQNE